MCSGEWGGGCFQEINHIRKGFPHFTGIYWYACVRVCVCVYIYIFFLAYLFYFFLIFRSHGGRTKIQSQKPFAMDNDNNRVSPIFSPIIHVRSFKKIVAHNFRVIKPCVFQRLKILLWKCNAFILGIIMTRIFRCRDIAEMIGRVISYEIGTSNTRITKNRANK